MQLPTEPNLRLHPRGVCRAAAVLVAAALAAAASAQQSNPPLPAEDDETIVLSPFVVDASQDSGYRATTTLAGSRINTSLRDLAASITEITPEFLSDVGATDINDVLTYTAGTEATRNFTDAPQQGIGGVADRPATAPQNANRIRGLNAATITRDYFISIGASNSTTFPTNLGFDAYNVDRVSINRGPNSILFGLGDPSGVVNYTPKVAKTNRNENEVSARVGANEDYRATVDFNRVLIDDKLALRVNGLWADRGFQQQPAYFKDKRAMLASTYKPWKGTSLQVSYEIVRQKYNNPNTTTPLDNVTQWVEIGRPTWNPATNDWSTRPSYFSSIAGGTALGATAPDGSLEYVFQEGVGNTYLATYYQQNSSNVQPWQTVAVSDERYIPLHDMNLNNSAQAYDLDTFSATWDQQLNTDLFLNVAYLNETMHGAGHGGFRSNQYAVHVDVNTHLPDGTVNPHYGELFMPQRSLDFMTLANYRNEAIRGTTTYNLDLTRQKGWAHWLGRHVFTGFGEHRRTANKRNVFNGTRGGEPSYLQRNDRINPSDWQVTRLRYLGGSESEQAQYAPVDPEMNVTDVQNTYWDAGSGSWKRDTYSDYFALKRRDLEENVVKSMAGIWQGYLLDGRVVATYGLRHDESSFSSKSSTDRSAAAGGFVVVNDTMPAATVISGNTQTYGVVVHPLKWLSLHYNRSENFVPVAGDVNIFGEPIGPPAGKGRDYGFSVDLVEGKLTARVNWYKLEATNARMGFTGPLVEAQWELPWFDQVVIPGLAAQYGLTHGPEDRFTPLTFGDARIAETSDQVSKGVEVEIIYNPTKDWRIMANVSKGEATQSNIAPGLTRWVEEVLPVWQAAPWFNGAATYDAGWGFSGNLQGYFNNFNTARNLATYKAFEGQTVQELREWHANLISNYEFHDGPVKGWNFGGAVRWESEAAIGYPGVFDQGGQLVGLDLGKAYTDGADIHLDLWVGYRRKILHDKVDWSLQLNVRDVTEKNGLKPIAANGDGTPSQFRIVFGPSWYLTSTFNF